MYQSKKTPFRLLISFKSLIDKLQLIADTDKVSYRIEYANSLLDAVKIVPELYTGFTDISTYKNSQELISNLVSELFPTALTTNEIKAISFPFQDQLFNHTQRFIEIIENAGPDFNLSIYGLDDHNYYIMCCNLILNRFYGEKLEIVRTLKYEIPDKNGIKNYYKINFNIDFIEVLPTNESVFITKEDIDLLKYNADDIDLWLKYFPPNSWLLKGFGIVSLIDITMDHAISKLKSTLINTSFQSLHQINELSDLYKSIFKIPDIEMGFLTFDSLGQVLKIPDFLNITTFSVDTIDDVLVNVLPDKLMDYFISTQNYIVFNVERMMNEEDEDLHVLAKHYKNKGVGSIILAPVVKEGKIVSVSELVSKNPDALNTLNVKKIENFMPFIEQTAERMLQFSQSQLEAIIQNEFTSIHKSVYWRFLEEARKYQDNLLENKNYNFKDIKFKNVFPLYGVSDIKSSTKLRIKASQIDLKNQLNQIYSILNLDKNIHNQLLVEQRKIEILHYIESIKKVLHYNVEFEITEFIKSKIHPFFKSNIYDNEFGVSILEYFNQLDPETELYYIERKKYDDEVNKINNKLASILDYRQVEAQQIFPHYYERFVSDGLDFNIYIGSSIAPERIFDRIYIQNLRLWQLQIMCELVRTIQNLQNIEYDINLTSLILVYSNPINIKFRMEEKKFDLDGAMNAFYEAVKKRLEKAFIKNTTQRIVEKNKLTIVYNNPTDELEYLKYITFLQNKKLLDNNLEFLEVEEMQSITGYKALRVDILNTQNPKNFYTYSEFLKFNLTDTKS